MALILLCEEDIDPTGSDVRCVRKDRICDIILQLYLSAQCRIAPLTKNETGPHMEQLSPNQEFSIWCVGQLEKKHCFCRVFAHFFGKFGALLPTTCMSGGYSKRKSELACFFEQYRALKQKSSAPQGFPPPTQL
jgi:hypothetical protein